MALCSIEKSCPFRTCHILFPRRGAGLAFDLGLVTQHTGLVVDKKIAPAREIGNSTFVFDQTHVLYSKLRPYLNKVLVPEEEGVSTTEMVLLKPEPKALNRYFLGYYLRSSDFINFASNPRRFLAPKCRG